MNEFEPEYLFDRIEHGVWAIFNPEGGGAVEGNRVVRLDQLTTFVRPPSHTSRYYEAYATWNSSEITLVGHVHYQKIRELKEKAASFVKKVGGTTAEEEGVAE